MIYAIYIHEEEDVKLPYIDTLHERGMTSPNSHNVHYAMHKRRYKAPPTHVYHIKKRLSSSSIKDTLIMNLYVEEMLSSPCI